jgi:hemolysin activation/secretion protein
VQYSYARQGEHLDLQQQLGLNLGVRGLGANDAQFEFKRAGAHAGFAYLRGSTDAVWHLPRGWSAASRLGYQYSEQPLISNEQLALGGVDTVRGYLDAEALVDSGIAAGLEVRAPAIEWHGGAGVASVFYDRGIGMMQQPLASEISSHSVRTDLEGWGVGLHVTIGQSLDAMVDWASPRRKGGRTRAGENRVDFSVKLSF